MVARMSDLISRDVTLVDLMFQCNHEIAKYKTMRRALGNVARAAFDRIKSAPAVPITGDTSDGYHTFNELYHHRAVLFSVICKAFPDKAWKSKRHHDGTMYDGMFIVGIDTPDGQATYHYDIDPYWDMFTCKEMDRAPEWDGHTPAQAIERIGKLEPVKHGHWIDRGWDGDGDWQIDGRGRCWYVYECSECSAKLCGSFVGTKYCHSCGAKMDEEV